MLQCDDVIIQWMIRSRYMVGKDGRMSGEGADHAEYQ